MSMAVQLAASQPSPESIMGSWGGDRLHLTIDESGGRIEMDCASGTIAGPLKVIERGIFNATGTFEPHRPGPQRADAVPPSGTAQYAGTIKDGSMTLSILPAGASAAQVFHLSKSAAAKLVRCL